MINEAQICLSGYVASEPIFKQHDSGVTSAKLRVAFTERRRSRETGEWSDGPTSFLNVQCWRTLAENVARCLHKGEPVMVRGRLQVRRFQSANGQWREVAEVDASSIGHDLTRGVALFSRTRKSAGETAAAVAGGPPVTPVADADGAGLAGAPGAAAGAVIDESAVAEFAAELDESLSAEPEPSMA